MDCYGGKEDGIASLSDRLTSGYAWQSKWHTMISIYESVPAASMSEEEREKVREQLTRLLETHHFRNSRRYPALLRFIVEETLEGRGEFLKERLLGVRVFDRPADYDTATDPVVRVTIAEIRKRIAQYYHDEEHDSELRIELLPGRYAPEFRSRAGKKEGTPGSASVLDTSELLVEPAVKLSKDKRVRWALAVVALCAVGFGGWSFEHWLRPSALDELWAPLLVSQQPILFCIPTDVGKSGGPGDSSAELRASASKSAGNAAPRGQTFLAFESLGENVVYSDVLATLHVANVLTSHHREYRVRLNVATNLEDLREGPSILIGGLDNQWTIRALAPLRFRFAGSDEDRYWIADLENPAARNWSLDLKQPYGAVTSDYAIVARTHNKQTGEPEMIVAGIGMSGTAAAGEFITDKVRVEELRRRIGAGFKDRDFEAVLVTDVVNGMAGSPRIVAVSVW